MHRLRLLRRCMPGIRGYNPTTEQGMRFWFVVIMSAVLGWSGELHPKVIVKTSAQVLDMVVRNGVLWASTADGKAFAVSDKGKISHSVAIAPLTNYDGETQPQKIMSLDLSPEGTTLALAGEDGRLYTSREGKLFKTAFSTRTVIKKIAFVSENKVILALLSNEIVFFDLAANKTIKSLSGGTSPLSDMALSEDRKIAAIAGEAGIVSLIDTGTMALKRHIKGGNVDNIYKIDYKNGRIITAGQDRRAIVYDVARNAVLARFDASFLIYGAALSPSGSIGVISRDEENRLSVVDVAKRRATETAAGHGATLNRIVFLDERRFASSADENKILLWEIP